METSERLTFNKNLRDSGIGVIGELPWSSHFCQFYKSKQDLIDILVNYFKGGLLNNEYCVWVTSEFLNGEEAKSAMSEAMPDFFKYLRKGQMEIFPYTDWYLKEGQFELKRVMSQWLAKHDQALAMGYDGLRVSGNPFWINNKKDWDDFTEYEAEINKVITNYNILVLCTYSLDKCGANEIIDVVNNHAFTIIKRRGQWEVIETHEHKKNNELRDQEKKISDNIIKAIPEGINIINEKCEIVYQNKVFKDLFGPDIIGKKCYEVYKDDKQQCKDCPLKKPLQVGETSTIEVSGVANGRIYLISHTGIMFGSKKHVLEVYRDITDYRKIEEKYLTLSNAVEQSHASIVITDSNGAIQYVNPYFTQATGYSWDEAIGKNPRILKSSKQPKSVYNDLWQTIKSGKNWQGEFCNKKKNGELYWERVSVSPVKNSAGEITHFVAVKEDFTDYKKSQEALQVSLRRYQSYIDLTGQLGWTTNAAGEVTDDIPSWRKFTGQTYEQIKGWGWTNALHPDDLKRTTIAWVEALKSKRRYEIQYRLRRQDGVYRYFMARGVPVFNDDGSVQEWVGTCIDITEREALDKKMEHLASFPRLSPTPVIETDLEGNVLFFNAATLEKLKSLGAGYDIDILLPPDLKKILLGLKKSDKTEPLRKEIKINDRYFAAQISLPEHLEVIRFYITEITKEKNTEERLAQERKIMDTIVENSSSSLAYLDIDFNYVWINAAFTKACSNRAGELIGKNHFDVFPDPENKDLFLSAKERGKAVTFKAKAFNKPGEPDAKPVYWDWRLTPIKDSGGKPRGFVYSVIDVTENKQAEVEKNNFIAIMSHELRNPLSPILSSAQLIQASLKQGQSEQQAAIFKESADIIERQSKTMSRLLDDLLDITRINRGQIQLKKQALDISTALKNVIKSAGALAESQKQTLSIILPSEPAYINADPLRLEQIAINLLNNAIKYTQAGGQIWLEINRSENGEEVEMRIRDTGLGIPRNRLESIFNLFSRISEPYVSTQGELGIGLKLTKDLVLLHGGTISVKSAGINQGSEFIVKFPALPQNYMPVDANTRVEAAPLAKEKSRVMIIDDNKDIADMQGELFNFYGFETKVLYDGPAALIEALYYKPEVVIIDIGLPFMDGYEVAREFRKLETRLNQKLKLIAATGYGQEDDKKRSKAAGFDYHFVKPVDFDAILKAIEKK